MMDLSDLLPGVPVLLRPDGDATLSNGCNDESTNGWPLPERSGKSSCARKFSELTLPGITGLSKPRTSDDVLSL
jgi:hypothetical protein